MHTAHFPEGPPASAKPPEIQAITTAKVAKTTAKVVTTTAKVGTTAAKMR
jgi:hypothetical protein